MIQPEAKAEKERRGRERALTFRGLPQPRLEPGQPGMKLLFTVAWSPRAVSGSEGEASAWLWTRRWRCCHSVSRHQRAASPLIQPVKRRSPIMSLAAASPLQCNEKSSDHIVSPNSIIPPAISGAFFPLMGPKWCTPFVIQAELHVVKLPNCLLEWSLPLTLHLIMLFFSSRHGLMASNSVWSGTIWHILWCLHFLPCFKSALLWVYGQT